MLSQNKKHNNLYFTSYSDRLNYAISIRGFTKASLSKTSQVKPQIIQYLCTGNAKKSKFTAKLAEALDIDPIWLNSGIGVKPKPYSHSNSNKKDTKNFIPIFSLDQVKKLKIDNNISIMSQVSTWLPISEKNEKKCFAIVINDPSMKPFFDLNTVVTINPDIDYLAINESRRFVLAYIKSEDYLIFRHLILKGNKKLLASMNKTLHKDIYLNNEDIILGVCEGIRW